MAIKEDLMTGIIKIRQFTEEGSIATTYTIKVAEETVRKALVSGHLVIDEDSQTKVIDHTTLNTSALLIIDPLERG